MLVLVSLIFLISLSKQYQLLNGIPITFKLAGNVSYTPTSGGLSTPGYSLQVGFYKYSWLGIKFMTKTTYNTYDVVIVNRASTPTGGYYQTTTYDFYISSANPTKLQSDTINLMDKNVQTYDDSNYFYIQLFRTKGDTRGEDWQGGDFVQICFYTNQATFNSSVWTDLYQSCYGYDVSVDYISTYRGKYIGQTTVDGSYAQIYGGIEGPVLQVILFWYCYKANLSSSSVYIRIGEYITNLGYDYYKCGSGDYFGQNAYSLIADTEWSGYNDGTCTVVSSSSSTKIAFTKKVFTSDDFDGVIYNKTQSCVQVGGGGEVCATIQMQILFPVMDVGSALILYANYVCVGFVMLFLVTVGII